MMIIMRYITTICPLNTVGVVACLRAHRLFYKMVDIEVGNKKYMVVDSVECCSPPAKY